ncbi:MAG: sodium:proton antiporter NhaD [Gammaproteobacteria bacterium]|nr:sodium:proton antiporter NhaD [Gammaproteobacteria bacterium]MDH5653886.1 sodium:proton antiporter NhaD [Gammaproteobacteria bacterium]
MRFKHHFAQSTAFCLLFLFPFAVFAGGDAAPGQRLDLTTGWVGITCVVIFCLAYVMVVGEEFLHLRKSKPVIVAAGIIWFLIGITYASHGDTTTAAAAIRHNLLEFAELMLFLLAAMTYINTMDERQVFSALRSWLIGRGFSLRKIFWITGLLAFFISPVADNLTTALLMGAVVMAVGGSNSAFVIVACINVVVAANAGGAFSPFGDITTLMVWQKGIVEFHEFFNLFIPSLINWLVPAFIMSFTVPRAETPEGSKEKIAVLPGGYIVIGLFVLTICLTVAGHNFLHLPPVIGMMTGLGLLKFYGYRIRRKELAKPMVNSSGPEQLDINEHLLLQYYKPRYRAFDIFISMKRAEWDTLMFFYGVVLAVGGLGLLGYLALVSQTMYIGLGPTWANVLVGLLSAIVDNIPVMFAVLTMNPEMSHGQWLLVTLTAGVGGSLLSIGSAAGVALMGQARGIYTFFAHLKWTWAIALGYALSIWAHLLLNKV